MGETTTITNMPPVWTFYAMAIALVIFGLATAVIAFVLVGLAGQLMQVLMDVKKMTDELNKKMPSMLGNVDATLGNVKAMSDDTRANLAMSDEH